MKNFFKKIKIEEYTCFTIFSFFLGFFIFLKFSGNIPFKGLFSLSLEGIKLTAQWWFYPIFIIFSLTPFFYLHLFLIKKRFPQVSEIKINLKLKDFFFLLRSLVLLILLFTFGLLLNGMIILVSKTRLVNNLILAWENFLFGQTPFFYLNSNLNPFKKFLDFFSPIFISSFFSLSAIMSICFLFFYLQKNSYFFQGLIISCFLSLTFGLVIWYFFPVNSPFNAFFNEFKRDLNFNPAPQTLKWIEKFRESQKLNPPVSTFPSMHWAWGVILVYFLWRKNKLTLFLTLPWFLFLALGSLLLGAHYLLDGILGIFISLVSIFLAENLISLGKKYYQDKREQEFKENLKELLFFPYKKELQILKEIFKRFLS